MIKIISLDRFSQPLSREMLNGKISDVVEIEPEKKCCQGCGYVLYFGEEAILETEWMDEFIHDDQECKDLYKQKEQRANATQSH